MRYFTYELISAANDWIEQSSEDHRKAERRLATVIKQYQNDLDSLQSRVSREAWNFFRYDFGREGLHDARLLSVEVGDGRGYVADGQKPFFLNRQRLSAVVKFLNFDQDREYVFDLRKVSRFSGDLIGDKSTYARSLGDLYTYELAAAPDEELELGFLFASGATMVLQFKRLVFRKRRVLRRYEAAEMYR